MISEGRARQLLEPFGIQLTPTQIGQVLTYLELLLRWNRKINLTAVRTAEECLTRHFGESLYLARWMKLDGRLVDIGSGAGFPGLALKIPFPDLEVTLLEPIAKKRAFLKEAARVCGMNSVEVRPERLDQFVRLDSRPLFQIATARAVGRLSRLVYQAEKCLSADGRLCLWVSRSQSPELAGTNRLVRWAVPIQIPLSSQKEIWIGTPTRS